MLIITKRQKMWKGNPSDLYRFLNFLWHTEIRYLTSSLPMQDKKVITAKTVSSGISQLMLN